MAELWWQLTITAFVLVTGWLLFADLRRKYKLRAIPGPTPWPIVGNLFQFGSVPFLSISEMQKKYGPVMKLWFGPKAVVILNSPETIKEAFGTYDTHLAQRPIGVASRLLGKGLAWSPYGDAQAFARKITVRELLSPARLQNYQDVRREDRLAALQEILDVGRDGTPVEMGTIFRKYMFTDMLRMLSHKQQVDSKMVHGMQAISDQIFHSAYLSSLGDYFPILRFFDVGGHVKNMKQMLKDYDVFGTQMLEDHRRKNEEFSGKNFEDPDFVDALLALPGRDTEKISDAVIKNILLDVISPSADTIPEALLWALVELSKNPHILQNAMEVLDKVVGRDRLVEETDIPNLHYFENIVRETLRLHPAAGLAVREAHKDVTIGGYHVPAGTYVFGSIYDSGMQESRWERPSEFDPDRFDRLASASAGRQFELISFGVGRRSCPGYHIAMLNMVVWLSQLVQVFHFELPNGMAPEDIDMGLVVSFVNFKKIPFSVVAKPRLPKKVYDENNLRV